MGTLIYFLLCSFVVVTTQNEVTLEADRPFLRVQLGGRATLKCCCTTNIQQLELIWVKRSLGGNITQLTDLTNSLEHVKTDTERASDQLCGILTFKSVRLKDSALYQCLLNDTSLVTHGTYLQVYKPIEKAINLSETTKNKILTAEGIILFLCVLLPAATLLCQSKKLNELERKKMEKEEENIYQGLNLDDCSATYDQIERSQACGPYQDVCNIMEEEEEIQLEKP